VTVAHLMAQFEMFTCNHFTVVGWLRRESEIEWAGSGNRTRYHKFDEFSAVQFHPILRVFLRMPVPRSSAGCSR